MRLNLQGRDLEFRVQERRIVTCSVFHQGKEIASDLAICAPSDQFDLRAGELCAVERTAKILYEQQHQKRLESMKKVDAVFTEVGAMSGNVELPKLDDPRYITEKVMEKLDARRERKAKEAAMLILKKLKIPFLTSPSGR